MTPQRRAEIEARLNAATPGPWKVYPNPMRSDGVFVAVDKPVEPYLHTDGTPVRNMLGEVSYPAIPRGASICHGQVEPTNGEFIAHAPTDIRDLLAEVERLRTALEESVKLQSHYAKVLNMYDQGERISFSTADEWLL